MFNKTGNTSPNFTPFSQSVKRHWRPAGNSSSQLPRSASAANCTKSNIDQKTTRFIPLHSSPPTHTAPSSTPPSNFRYSSKQSSNSNTPPPAPKRQRIIYTPTHDPPTSPSPRPNAQRPLKTPYGGTNLKLFTLDDDNQDEDSKVFSFDNSLPMKPNFESNYSDDEFGDFDIDEQELTQIDTVVQKSLSSQQSSNSQVIEDGPVSSPQFSSITHTNRSQNHDIIWNPFTNRASQNGTTNKDNSSYVFDPKSVKSSFSDFIASSNNTTANGDNLELPSKPHKNVTRFHFKIHPPSSSSTPSTSEKITRLHQTPSASSSDIATGPSSSIYPTPYDKLSSSKNAPSSPTYSPSPSLRKPMLTLKELDSDHRLLRSDFEKLKNEHELLRDKYGQVCFKCDMLERAFNELRDMYKSTNGIKE
ncbi:hypothetical protein BKA69DRAFT_1041104 [Paraphysoderma sedebokerense]|nr:hypothetical protein BKA69DRAFT_1041104 [Paraphysoderma sedebokerense]